MNQSNQIESLLEAKDNIITIIKSMVKMSSKEIEDRLLGKVELVSNEMLTNIQKYEKTNRFAVGINFANNMIYLYFLVIGDGMNPDEIKNNITRISKIDLKKEIILNGMGFYNCYKNSDHFAINKIDADDCFKKEIVFGFVVDKNKKTEVNK